MANFSVTNSTVLAGVAQNALTATYQALIAIAPSSGAMVGPPANLGLRRGKLYDILVGTDGTPADNYIEWEVIRATVGTTLTWLGSVSSVSSGYALDLADAGFQSFVTINTSAQTNVAATAQPWYVGVNQRASYRWVAAPGSEIVHPATSSATTGSGLALAVRSVGGYTGTATGNLLWQEQ
jgi:hypothetical protein